VMSETERLRAKKKQIYEDLKDAVERECVDSLYERIKLLEKRVIDLQGHDDLSYIDKRLSEYSKVLYRIKPSDQGDYILESVVPTTFGGNAVNYVFRGRLEDCEIVRDQLVGLTSQSQSETGNKIQEQK
jgi:hypothetical protein